MNTLAERLNAARISAGLTQEALAKKAGVTRVAISKAEQGLTKNFNGDTLFKIASALNCNPQWLQSGRGDEKAWEKNIKSTTQPEIRYNYPVLNWVQAGNFAECGDNYSMYDIDNWRESVKYAGKRGFWLEVHGDSMSSPVGISFPEGMSILVNPEADPYSNSYVIARKKSTDEVTFKKYVYDLGREFLSPLNPQYPIIEMDDDCEIVGVVVDARWDIF
ncbi:LexA family transcriptional repressor [Kosakonia cowanii]|nr:LexA family transcriptional repressor [Kosakonia cowanii]